MSEALCEVELFQVLNVFAARWREHLDRETDTNEEVPS